MKSNEELGIKEDLKENDDDDGAEGDKPKFTDDNQILSNTD